METSVIRDTLNEFTRQAKALEGWKGLKGEAAIQAAVDLAFLSLLNGDDVGKDDQVQSYLTSVSPASRIGLSGR